MTYGDELKDHIEYLEQSISSLQGVWNGCLIYDSYGSVIDRVGRISFNPPWYQEAYRTYGRRPNKMQLAEIARDHLDCGFWDIGGFIPPLVERI
jgi:hypothetical protein